MRQAEDGATLDEISVLIVEDDMDIADLLNSYLRKEGFRALIAGDGERAKEILGQQKIALALVDLGLPGAIDGIGVLSHIRSTSDIPVLIVTARDSELDRITGFEVGADDYITKPFSPREVVARVKAIIRRSYKEAPRIDRTTTIGDVTIDLSSHRVTKGGQEVTLATKEFELLALLVENRFLALTREQILEGVWGSDFFGDERTINVHIRQLRRKLGDDFPIATIWGIGYRLD